MYKTNKHRQKEKKTEGRWSTAIKWAWQGQGQSGDVSKNQTITGIDMILILNSSFEDVQEILVRPNIQEVTGSKCQEVIEGYDRGHVDTEVMKSCDHMIMISRGHEVMRS